MVIAYHLVWTAYGWWLPNDPRGSMSQCIRNDVLRELGELHHGRKPVQPASIQIRDFYERAGPLLQHPLLTFTSSEIERIAIAFGQVISNRRYTCYACAIMPDHVHVLIRKHRDKAEEMIGLLQHESRAALLHAGLREHTHPVWGGCGWKVFLDSLDEVRRTVRYIEQNQIKLRLPEQRWAFVQRYDGWGAHLSRMRVAIAKCNGSRSPADTRNRKR
jgi:REP element-mobilizing transposase RayT